MHRSGFVPVAAACCLLLACSDDGSGEGSDAGVDALGQSDAGADATSKADANLPHDGPHDGTSDQASSSVLFSDAFERADTETGLDNGWIVNLASGSPPSTFGIADGRAFPFFGEPKSAPLFHAVPSAFRPAPFAEQRVRVSVDLVTVGGSYDGLVVLFARSQTSTNAIDDTYFCGFLAAAKKLYIMKLDSGVLDALAISGPDVLPLPESSSSTLSFTLDGSELSCSLEGAVNAALSASDATFDGGYFGMAGGKPNQNYLRFDDFSIETL